MRADYVTRPRERIAEIMRAGQRFLTAAEIHALVQDGETKIALSTVYRTVEHWLSKGEVTSRVEPDGEASYMLCEPDRHHHHAICRTCGRVEDVDCTAVDGVADALRAKHGFVLDGHAMEFQGRCRECA